MTRYKIVLTAGFAMFSMFFGSGNLVFPLLVGKESLSQYPLAIAGFIMTAVLVPFLGLIGMVLFNGDYRAYFNKLGRIPAFLLIAAILMLIGPFGVVPRCITVAYGGFSLVFPYLPFSLFSVLFCGVVIACIWTESRIVDIIGLFLTPFKLGGIVLLILFGLWFGQTAIPVELSSRHVLTNAVFQGYHTMDLMAAFFFSSAIVSYIRNHLPLSDNNKFLFQMSLGASLIGAFLLTLVYIGFISLGAKYAPYLQDTQPEQLLVAIGGHALGYFAKPVIAIVLAIGCLATAVILSTLFVEFLQQDMAKNRLKRPSAIFITMSITFAISLLGFSQLMAFLGTVLEVAYPALIALAVVNILDKLASVPYAQWAFWVILAGSTGLKVLG